jgi:hypothetical protein
MQQVVLSQQVPCGNAFANAGDTLQIVEKFNQDGLLSITISKTPDQRSAFEIEGMINSPQGIFLSLRMSPTMTSEDSTVTVWIVKLMGGNALMVPSDEEFAAVSQLSRPAPIKPLLESLIGFFP